MNYHIMVQNVFFNSYIEDFYEIGEEKNNVFLFRGNKGGSDHIRTKYPVEYIGDDSVEIKKRLSSIMPTDNIFIHWYDMFIGEIIYDLPNKIFVALMGGDFYAEPLECNVNFLYDKQTRKVVYQFNKNLRKIYFRRNLIRMFQYWRKKSKEIRDLYKLKHKYISRIDYLLCLAEAKSEVEFIKKKYPKFKAVHLSFNSNQNFDETLIAKKTNKTNNRIQILLGNSIDPSNNHFDALELLKKLKDKITVYCSLSYGDVRYRDLIIKKGQEIFGEHFHPITDFVTKEQYIEFINSIDLVMMFHNRSQAMGNIAIALTLGKPVFLKKNNPIYSLYSDLGVKCYDAKRIIDTDLDSVIGEQEILSQSNFMILKKLHSKERRLDDLRKIIKEYC